VGLCCSNRPTLTVPTCGVHTSALVMLRLPSAVVLTCPPRVVVLTNRLFDVSVLLYCVAAVKEGAQESLVVEESPPGRAATSIACTASSSSEPRGAAPVTNMSSWPSSSTMGRETASKGKGEGEGEAPALSVPVLVAVPVAEAVLVPEAPPERVLVSVALELSERVPLVEALPLALLMLLALALSEAPPLALPLLEVPLALPMPEAVTPALPLPEATPLALPLLAVPLALPLPPELWEGGALGALEGEAPLLLLESGEEDAVEVLLCEGGRLALAVPAVPMEEGEAGGEGLVLAVEVEEVEPPPREAEAEMVGLREGGALPLGEAVTAKAVAEAGAMLLEGKGEGVPPKLALAASRLGVAPQEGVAWEEGVTAAALGVSPIPPLVLLTEPVEEWEGLGEAR
jgi:hypothetical protein